ncbi:MAG: hypothetical protein WKF30_17205 [Pyrinomonadaceae bacterium]
MRAGVGLRQLTFADYLGAIGHAYDAYQAASQSSGELRLKHRNAAGRVAGYVYNKGLLVALLCDLTQSAEQGREGLDRVYRDLFQRFGQPSVSGTAIVPPSMRFIARALCAI